MQDIKMRKNRVRNALSIGALAVALGGGYALRGSVVGAQQQPNNTPVVNTPATQNAVAMQSAFEQVANAVAPAVVTITTERKAPRTGLNNRMRPRGFGAPNPNGEGGDPFEEFFRQFRNFGFSPNAYEKEQMRAKFYEVQGEGRGSGLGSGMIYRSDGLILTNAHVVQGATNVSIKLNDEREFKNAKVLGIDERSDVAVVKINATNLPTVQLGDSAKVQVGDWAIAIGNPFGLTHSVTVGVISAKAREVQLSRGPGDYFQTDASINPGNSGGPLVDIYGRVIGINNAIYSQSGGNIGIGFAVPINTARDIANTLEKGGRIHRGYLGVGITDVADRAAALGLDPNLKGVLIERVEPDTPGARAGLQENDVIIGFNGQTVTKSSELQRLVAAAPVGSNATIKVLRDGKTLELTAKLDELKDTAEGGPSTTPDKGDNGQATPGALGLSLRVLNPELAQQLGIKQTSGLLVAGVDNDSPAEAAGITRGDVITRVGQTPVTTVAQLQAAVKRILGAQTGDDKSVALYIAGKGNVVVHVEK